MSSLATKDNEEDGDPESDWSGYMAKKASKVGYKGKPTQFIFGPLVDSTPAHPDTVLTSMEFIDASTKSHGQVYTHVMADMQLYKLILKIKWTDLERWKNLIVRPRGMHTVMSFIGV